MGAFANLNLANLVAAPLAEAGLLLLFLFAAGVTAVASVGFVAWAAYQVLRIIVLMLMRLLLIPVGGGSRCRARAPQLTHLACLDPVCRSVNPMQARFCRQCGRPLRGAVQLIA